MYISTSVSYARCYIVIVVRTTGFLTESSVELMIKYCEKVREKSSIQQEKKTTEKQSVVVRSRPICDICQSKYIIQFYSKISFTESV